MAECFSVALDFTAELMVSGLNIIMVFLRTLIDFHSNIFLEIDSYICENVSVAKIPHLKTLRH